MLKNIIMINEKEDEKSKLNSFDPHINRGFELMLRHNSRREPASKPKTFHFCFGKMLSLFRREMHFQIEFSFNMEKK
jgi:hypothetical protein